MSARSERPIFHNAPAAARLSNPVRVGPRCACGRNAAIWERIMCKDTALCTRCAKASRDAWASALDGRRDDEGSVAA